VALRVNATLLPGNKCKWGSLQLLEARGLGWAGSGCRDGNARVMEMKRASVLCCDVVLFVSNVLSCAVHPVMTLRLLLHGTDQS
jgi:hypothetical protein